MKQLRIFLIIALSIAFIIGFSSCVVVKNDRYGTHYRLNKKDSKQRNYYYHIGPNKGQKPRINSKGSYHPNHDKPKNR